MERTLRDDEIEIYQWWRAVNKINFGLPLEFRHIPSCSSSSFPLLVSQSERLEWNGDVRKREGCDFIPLAYIILFYNSIRRSYDDDE